MSEIKKPKIVIDRHKYDHELGIKIAKAKSKELDVFLKNNFISEKLRKIVVDSWNNAEGITVREALSITNLEARRIAFRYIGVENVFNTLKPELVDTQIVKKATRVNDKGELEKFDDEYRLYRVDGKVLLEGAESGFQGRTPADFYILRCSCTSTAREYLIYIQDIWTQNRWNDADKLKDRKPDAVEAVAWTIQVDVAAKDIDYIVRQGDAIMVKTLKDKYEKVQMRHISKEEYLTKVKMES